MTNDNGYNSNVKDSSKFVGCPSDTNSSDRSDASYASIKKKIGDSCNFRNNPLEYLKFLLLPGYQVSDYLAIEDDLGKLKSKRKFFRRILNPLTLTGILFILISYSIAMFSPWLTPFSNEAVTELLFSGRFAPPSPDHPLGQTFNGWDVWARLVWGARGSLTVGFQAIMISIVFGVPLGIIAVYFGGWVDSLIMRLTDLILSFPVVILALVFVAIWGKDIKIIMLVLGVLAIPSYIRLIRGSALQVKENLYITSSKAAGSSDFNLMFKHILPNSINPVIISASYNLGQMVIVLAAISFFGFNDPSIVSWGEDLNATRFRFYSTPWAFFYPAIAIIFTALGFILMGDGLRDALDPRLKIKNK